MLLEKLIQIERAIGVESNFTLQKMLIEAEDYLLQLEKELVENLRMGTQQATSEPSALLGYRPEQNGYRWVREPRSTTEPIAKTQV
jgi:hypothetical protein